MSIDTKATEPSATNEQDKSLWDRAYDILLQSGQPEMGRQFTVRCCESKPDKLRSIYKKWLETTESKCLARSIKDAVEKTPGEAMFTWVAIVQATSFVL